MPCPAQPFQDRWGPLLQQASEPVLLWICVFDVALEVVFDVVYDGVFELLENPDDEVKC